MTIGILPNFFLSTAGPANIARTMKLNDPILYSISMGREMLTAMTADLTAADWEHRAVPGSNCAAWLVGHLILTERRALALAGVTDLPELPEGFETRFGRDGSAPQAEHFGDATILIPLFDKHRQLLLAAVAKMSPEALDAPLPKPNPRFKTFGEFFTFMGLHVIMHAGQISTIRRSLGRPPLF
jgi:hypothetical protein